jgi:antitoxin component YwqK of YwqJK toxin-antitoxin module
MKRQIIFLCFLAQLGFCQTKIKLTSPQSKYDNYHLENISDTIYIEITHQEDMGARYGQTYRLKSNVPDGKYEIYVDNNLELRALIKDHKKNGVWKTFYSDGKLQSIRKYKDGVCNGKILNYHKNGKVSSRGKCINGKMKNMLTSYYESGKIQAKNYYVNGEHVKQEVYYENGKLKLTCDPRTGIITKAD